MIIKRGHRGRIRRPAKPALQPHRTRREGDEEACSCGKRWPVGEDHP